MRLAIALSCMLVFTSAVTAEPYEESYYPPESPYVRGEDVGGPFPEEAPWDWERYTTGGGADRTAGAGVLTLEAEVPGISDMYLQDKNGELDAEPGERFYAEWRVRLDPEATAEDVTVYVSTDEEAGDIELGFAPDYVYSFYEYRLTEVDTTVWHTYRIESVNMLDYDFYVDGLYIYTKERKGTFYFFLDKAGLRG